jgi:two-component system phosphate regulon response regulator PhoB
VARLLVLLPAADRTALLDPLRAEGHAVSWFTRADDGLRAAALEPPDLVLLDASLPDRNALVVTRELKSSPSRRDLPVVVVSSSPSEIDRVVSLELGAEDYVVRPYSPRELSLRVRAILRRRAPRNGNDVQGDAWANLRVDRGAHRVWVDGREVQLSAMEWRLFLYLFDAREQVRTREELLRDVWGIAEDAETRSLDAMVKRLRGKLGDAGRLLWTVRGVGYRLSDA